MMQARIDQVMLKEMVGNYEVGQYSAALRVIEAFAFIPVAIKQSLMPSLTNAKKKNNSLYVERFVYLYKLIIAVSVVNLFGLLIFGKFATLLLFGQEYTKASELVFLFALRLFVAYFGVIRGMHLLIESQLIYSFVCMLLGTMLNVVLNLLLIPGLESYGAIIAMLISFTVVTFVVDIFYQPGRKNLLFIGKAIKTFFV